MFVDVKWSPLRPSLYLSASLLFSLPPHVSSFIYPSVFQYKPLHGNMCKRHLHRWKLQQCSGSVRCDLEGIFVVSCRIWVTAVKKRPGYKEEYIYGKARTSMALVQSGVHSQRNLWTAGAQRGHDHSVTVDSAQLWWGGHVSGGHRRLPWLALAEEDEGVCTGGRQPETEAWTQAAKPHRVRRGPNA